MRKIKQRVQQGNEGEGEINKEDIWSENGKESKGYEM